MSRVGKMPIPIPEKTEVTIDGQVVSVKGPKGTLTREVNAAITVAIDGDNVVVTRSTDLKPHRALHGLTRALVNNMVVGVSQGFKKVLDIIGVGYRGEVQGKMLTLNLGFSHPIFVIPPDGVDISVVPKKNRIIVEGIDKELVGEVAAKIRSFRKPEPYKGKGVRYVDEYVRTKAGKSAGA